MNALVSIIVPIYNNELYIDESVNSLVNQTYKNLEIILVDDGSCDKSLSKCIEWEKKDRRIKVIHQKNQGAFEARKTGLKIANGKYVGFLDGDDWIESNMYEEMVRIIESTDVCVVDSAIIEDNGSERKRRKQRISPGLYEECKYKKEIIPKMLYAGIFYDYGILPCLVSKLFKIEEFKKIYFSIEDGGAMGNDAACVYPYLLKNNSIYITDKCYYNYRIISKNSITRKNYNSIYEKVNVHINVMKHFFESSEYAKDLMKQLSFYRVRAYTLFCPWVFDDGNSILQIFGGVNSDEKIVLYGAGKCGIRIYPYVCEKMKNNLVAWVDKNFRLINQTSNLPVTSPEILKYENVDKVVITAININQIDKIRNDLRKMGVDEKKIHGIDAIYIDNPQMALDLIKGGLYVDR